MAGGDIKRERILRVRPQSVLTKSRSVNGASPAYDVWVANAQLSRNPASFGPCYHILFNVKEIMKTGRIKAKVGSDIDSWCGKCKRILAHTVEAMVGDKPARVNCNTCKSQHFGY